MDVVTSRLASPVLYVARRIGARRPAALRPVWEQAPRDIDDRADGVVAAADLDDHAGVIGHRDQKEIVLEVPPDVKALFADSLDDLGRCWRCLHRPGFSESCSQRPRESLGAKGVRARSRLGSRVAHGGASWSIGWR